MYVKIKEYLDAKGVFPKHGHGDLVVPNRSHLFEAERVEFKKVRVSSKKELDDAFAGIMEYTIIGYVPLMCNCLKGEGNVCDICRQGELLPLPDFEFIVVTIDAIDHYVVNGELFIMNNQGKTIDSLVCH